MRLEVTERENQTLKNSLKMLEEDRIMEKMKIKREAS
jgi:hypothetical protein